MKMLVPRPLDVISKVGEEKVIKVSRIKKMEGGRGRGKYT